MRLVSYRRVSTDDKGQDPERQQDVMDAFAARPKSAEDPTPQHEIVGRVTDEGISGGVTPFQRQGVLEAIELAKELGAEGILVEAVDRWTRGGVEDLSVSRFFLRLDHDLRLVCANTPGGLTAEMEELWDSMMATVARMFRSRLREQIKSGLARAKAQGWPRGEPGRKPKPGLSEVEAEKVIVMLENYGLRKTALELSKMRGAFDVADPKAQRERSVSCAWLKKQVVARQEMRHLCLRLEARRRGASLTADLESSRPPRQSAAKPTAAKPKLPPAPAVLPDMAVEKPAAPKKRLPRFASVEDWKAEKKAETAEVESSRGES